MPGRIDGRNALITGGTSGLGLETARLFLEEGASVIITGRDAERGAIIEAELRKVGPVEFLRADAASQADARMAVRHTEERFGRLDILVANAGVLPVGPLSETTPEAWQTVLDINVTGYLFTAQEAMAAMRRGGSGGAIVLIGSDAGIVGERALGAYSVTKAAVVMMSKVLAMDGAPHGIRVNCLCPGHVAPGMRRFAATAPGGRLTTDGGSSGHSGQVASTTHRANGDGSPQVGQPDAGAQGSIGAASTPDGPGIANASDGHGVGSAQGGIGASALGRPGASPTGVGGGQVAYDPPFPPLGRYGEAREIAQGVLYLVGDESTFCTGTVLMLEGGMTAGIF